MGNEESGCDNNTLNKIMYFLYLATKENSFQNYKKLFGGAF